jgi:hypothetical protein
MNFSLLVSAVLLVTVVPDLLANSNNSVAKQDSVEVYKCAANPDAVKVSHGGNLHWVVRNNAGEDQDQGRYNVDFGDTTNNPISGAQPTFSIQMDDKPHRVNVPDCTLFTRKGCGDRKYILNRGELGHTSAPCTDPIVRVIPPSLIELLVQNLAISLTGLLTFLLLAYVAYKTLARN